MRTRTSPTGDDPRPRRRRPGEGPRFTPGQGFTIVELVVVIVVVTVLAGMIVPRLVGAGGAAQLREAARRLVIAAGYARDFAAAHRCACRLVLASSADGAPRYALVYQASPERNPNDYRPLRKGIGKPQPLGEGIRFSKVRIDLQRWSGGPDGPEAAGEDQPDGITFEPTGRADAAIVALTDGRRTISMLVSPSTGRARLVEGEVDELPNDRIDLDD